MWLLREQANGCSVDPPSTEGFLFSDSILEPELIQAFLETEYQVAGDSSLVLKIGISSPELVALHKAHRVESSAFITACNPFSQPVDDDTTAKRHAALTGELKQRSLSFIEGIGQHPSNQWPGEASFLILGLSLEAARTLGVRLEQNAIVWAGSDAVPQLILLR